MARLLGSKVGNINLLDAAGASVVKYLEENALASVIGNGTVMSGIAKVAIGMIAGKFLGRGLLGDAVRLGFTIDGFEDIMVNVLGGFAGLGGGENW